MDDNLNIEILEAVPEKPKSKRGGHRFGAGRPSLVRQNNERIEQGLEPIDYRKGLNKKAPKKQKSNAILPMSKKARTQEILAEMMTRKGKYIVSRIIEKALDDDDKDQMSCMQIVIDRILPKDYMAKAKSSGNSININITSVGETVIEAEEDVQDAEFEDIDDEL